MKISLAFFAAILGTVASFGGTFNTSGYGRTTTLVCSGYSGASSLVNFPVLVKFATNRVDQFYYQDFKVNASDLRFTDSDGNEIPYEIDTWNTNGTSVVWVSAPSLTSATTLHAYWNNAAATKPASIRFMSFLLCKWNCLSLVFHHRVSNTRLPVDQTMASVMRLSKIR